METGLSLFNPDASFLQNIAATNQEEEEAALDALQREKEIKAELENYDFGDLSADDDDEDYAESSHFSEDHHTAEDEPRFYPMEYQESTVHGENSTVTSNGQSSLYEQSSENQQDDNNLSKESFSKEHDENVQTDNFNNYLEATQRNSDRFNDFSLTYNLPQGDGDRIDNETIESHKTAEFKYRGNFNYQQISKSRPLTPVVEISFDEEPVVNRFNTSDRDNSLQESEQFSMPREQFGGQHSKLHISEKNNFNVDPHEEFIKLQVLYKVQGRELEELKRTAEEMKEETDRDIRILKLNLNKLQGEKDGLHYSLKQSQQLVSERSSENNVFQGQLAANELQLSAERQAKEDILKKLESAETTIQSLSQQITELSHSENMVRARKQHEHILTDQKLRHQQETLKLKKEIDVLKEHHSSKINEVDVLQHQVERLEKRCDQLQMDKGEALNRLTASLEASQRQCQQLLESGTLAEVSKLKMQMQHLESQKEEIENENKLQKEELDNLLMELKSNEMALQLKSWHSDYNKEPGHQQSAQRQSSNSHQDPDNLLSSLQAELERSLNNLRSQRTLNTSLRNELTKRKKELPVWMERAKLFESRFEELQKKVGEYEKKLEDLSPDGSIPMVQYQKEVNALKKEKAEMEGQLKEVTIRLNEVATNEERVNEINRKLRTEMSALVQDHDEDKNIVLQRCRESCLQLHQDAMASLKKELESNFECELKKNCNEYENRIDQMNKEIGYLNDNLHEVQTQYIALAEETKSLDSSLQGHKKYKQGLKLEIGNELRKQYEKKYELSKEKHNEEIKKRFEEQLEEEIYKAQEIWAKQKVQDVENFIANAKQEMDKEFQTRWNKEQEGMLQQVSEEKKAIVLEYEEKIEHLKKKYIEEKDTFLRELTENLRSKLLAERNNLEMQHQSQLKKIAQHYEEKLTTLKDEIQEKQQKLDDVSKKEEIRKLEETVKEMKQDKDNNEKKIKLFIETENALKEKLSISLKGEVALNDKLSTAVETEKRLRQRLTKYGKQIENVSKKYRDEKSKFKQQLLDLQKTYLTERESKLQELKEKYEARILQLEANFKVLRSTYEVSKTNNGCQTEEAVIAQSVILIMNEMFLNSLNKIKEKVKMYLIELKKRRTDQLQQALLTYHKELTQRISEGIKNNEHLVETQSSVDNTTVNSEECTSTFLNSAVTNSDNLTETNSHGKTIKNKECLSTASKSIIKTHPKLLYMSIPETISPDFSKNRSVLSQDQRKFLFKRIEHQKHLINSPECLLASDTAAKFIPDKTAVFDESLEFLNLPSHKTSADLLKKALNIPPEISSNNLHEILNNYYPDQWSIDRESTS